MEAELIAALLARLGGTADISSSELEAAKGLRIQVVRNPVTGDVQVSLPGIR